MNLVCSSLSSPDFGESNLDTANELAVAALALAPEQKLWLIDQIWNTLPPEQWPPLPDAEVSEIQRRSAAYDAGQELASDWETVRARLPLRKSSNR
jgi:putative addiction module component (TIGR02574 family)